MALKTGTAVSIVGPTGPMSIVTVSAPPGPNVGVVGGYALWPPASGAGGNGNVVLLYGPKLSTGWAQTTDGNGNQTPVSTQLTGATGAAGSAGTNGSNGVDGATIRSTSGVPANTVGNVNDIAIDALQGFVYGPKKADGTWPSTPLVSTVGPAGPKGDVGAAAVLPNDYKANSFVVQPVSGDNNTVQLAILNASGTVLWSADASGNTTVGGTLKVTGASTLAAVSATTLGASGATTLGGTLSVTGNTTLAGASCTGMANSGNATIGGTLGVTGAATLAGASCTTLSASGNGTVGGTLAITGTTTAAAITSTATVTAKNLTVTSGGGGVVTFADGTTQATAATGTATNAISSRTIIDLGGNANSSQAANSLWTYERTNANENAPTTSTRVDQTQVKMPYPFTVTGWALTQFQAAGTQTFQIVKNRTGGSLGSIVTVTAGSATTAGFPGNAFQGTFTKGTYNFAAGDSIGAVGMNGTAGASDVHLWLTIEWTG